MKKVIINLSLGFIALILITGCSQHLYSKPSVFLQAESPDRSGTFESNTSHIYCLNGRGELQLSDSTKIDEYGSCDGYYTMVLPKEDFNVSKINTPDSSQSARNEALVNELLYFSDRNCVTFINRFFYNELWIQNGSNALNIGIGSVGIQIGEIQKITAQQIGYFTKNLNDNMKKRKQMRQYILKDLNVSGKANFFSMLNAIHEYDTVCSLHPTYSMYDLNDTK